MLLGGDELGRSQLGNNNAYCQDNEISWFDWDRVDLGLVEYTSRLLALRRRFPVLRRRRFPAAADEDARCWFTIDGQPVTPADWQDPSNRCLALHLESAGNTDDLLLMVNGWWEPACFMLPPKLRGSSTRIEIDSFDLDGDQRQVSPDEGLILGPRSLLVLSLRRDQTG
jgi:glycogen operon protein